MSPAVAAASAAPRRLWARAEAAWQALDAEWRQPGAAAPSLGLLAVVFTASASLAVAGEVGQLAWFDAVFGAPAPGADLRRGLWWALVPALLFALPTSLVARAALGCSWRELGLGLGRSRAVLPAVGIWLALVLPGVVHGASQPAQQALYPLVAQVSEGPVVLGLWLVAYGAQLLGLEVLLRGALLMPLARRMGVGAILVTLPPTVLLHQVWDKSLAETLGGAVYAVFSGVIALRARSIWPCVLVHVATAWTMDLAALALRA